MSNKPSRDDVLASFAVEEHAGPGTLKRYLSTYPEFARDLVHLSREMHRSWSDDEPLSAEQKASIGAAMQRLAGAPVAIADLNSAPPSVFGVAADVLGLPLQVLAAIRQRRVEPASVPAAFMARLAEALKTSAAQLMAYLEQPPLQAVPRSAKADGKPTEPTKVGIERLLVDAGVPQDRIEELMR
jgi:hypothetical protein